MRTLVMGDIHGAHSALLQCLERSGFDPQEDVLIQLGDVTDRNPHVYECVETLLTLRNLIALKGNHDDWLLSFIQTGYHPNKWGQGGRDTIESYSRHLANPVAVIHQAGGTCKTSLQPSDIPATHQAFFISQRTHFIDDNNNCFVHAGFDSKNAFTEQPERNYYWDRSLWKEAMFSSTEERFQTATSFNEIFLGHTPTTNRHTDKPLHFHHVWNLDTGAGHHGKLTIMDVQTKEYWQSDKI